MNLIIPQWPAPSRVRACSTQRQGGVSTSPWDALNLGGHVGDNPDAVARNRQLLVDKADLPAMPQWLEQVHGTEVVRLTAGGNMPLRADACITDQPGVVCAIMTADCLPVLFCNRAGTEVAAAHAGWRGLCEGVLEETVACFNDEPDNIIAWLGPAIGPRAFEVGPEVREAFMAKDPQAVEAFLPSGGKYLADIYTLARQRLNNVGVTQIFGGDRCTFTEKGDFFSYRRDKTTGRMASFIWLI